MKGRVDSIAITQFLLFTGVPVSLDLQASVRYILRLGMSNIHGKNMKVANLLRNDLSKMPDVKIYGPEDDKLRTSIFPFTFKRKQYELLSRSN